MKKAYNVYEKANIPAILRSISLAFVFGVCFLGFQTQASAQAAAPDAIGADVTQSDIKDLHNNYDLANISLDAQEVAYKLKEFGYTVQSVEHSTTAGELEQVTTLEFIKAVNERLFNGTAVPTAVQNAYVATMALPVVELNANHFDAQRTLERVIALID